MPATRRTSGEGARRRSRGEGEEGGTTQSSSQPTTPSNSSTNGHRSSFTFPPTPSKQAVHKASNGISARAKPKAQAVQDANNRKQKFRQLYMPLGLVSTAVLILTVLLYGAFPFRGYLGFDNASHLTVKDVRHIVLDTLESQSSQQGLMHWGKGNKSPSAVNKDDVKAIFRELMQEEEDRKSKMIQAPPSAVQEAEERRVHTRVVEEVSRQIAANKLSAPKPPAVDKIVDERMKSVESHLKQSLLDNLKKEQSAHLNAEIARQIKQHANNQKPPKHVMDAEPSASASNVARSIVP